MTHTTEGFFNKKASPKEQEVKDLEQKLSNLSMKSSGKSGWSEKEQDKYNDIWIELHKMGRTPEVSPPSVYGDSSWGTKTKALQKKLKLTTRDHKGVLA